MTETLIKPADLSLPDQVDVAIVGGGQAGLAMGHALRTRGLRPGTDFAILDANTQVGATWAGRWESLRLFTPAAYSALPGLPFPGPPDAYPTKDAVALYLARYAAHFDLSVVHGTRVDRAGPDAANGGYTLATSRGVLRARKVVAATGPFQVPAIPRLADGLAQQVVALHSSAYRGPAQLPPGRVLVVGAGNSGAQIAAELAATHQVTLAAGTRQPNLPQRLAGRDLFYWATRTKAMEVTVDSRLGRRLSGKEALIGTRLRDLADAGVVLGGRLVAADGTTAWLADRRLEIDAVVWATGYRPDYSWMPPEAVGANGWPVHQRGLTPLRGLAALGLPWLHTRGSALLGWVGEDAAWIADHLVTSRIFARAYA